MESGIYSLPTWSKPILCLNFCNGLLASPSCTLALLWSVCGPALTVILLKLGIAIGCTESCVVSRLTRRTSLNELSGLISFISFLSTLFQQHHLPACSSNLLCRSCPRAFALAITSWKSPSLDIYMTHALIFFRFLSQISIQWTFSGNYISSPSHHITPIPLS